MSLPFGTQQAFFSRVELVAPVDDWRASRCVARCPACVCFFFLDAVARGEQSFGAVVPHGLARGCTAALAQGCTGTAVAAHSRTVARVAVVKGAPKFRNNAQAPAGAGTARATAPGRYRMYLIHVPRYLGDRGSKVRWLQAFTKTAALHASEHSSNATEIS